MDFTSRGEENPACGSAIPPVVVVPEDGQGNVSPTSLVEKIFNDPEALTMLRKAILNEESGEALKARHPQEKNAGALKARETATTLEGPATKRPRRADSPPTVETDENVEFEENFLGGNDESFEIIDDEDGQAQSASRWHVDSVYTPDLDDYLTSLVPGVKAVDKQSKFLQDRLLDTLGPVSQLFEHIFGMLSQCQPGKTIDLTYEQLNELGSITSNAIRLLGNTSALLSQERRKAVLQKINSQSTLASLASEEFPQAGRSLFGEGFEERIRTRSETAKTLLQAASQDVFQFIPKKGGCHRMQKQSSVHEILTGSPEGLEQEFRIQRMDDILKTLVWCFVQVDSAETYGSVKV
ncbi:Hypothetical predicted protein [Paramuricea clavata]|uniref:Uncharacterized protein n=1 Tax=Paramuricea clavata TaxID=317549 RepID=A0A7D9DF44_PARCT|nr:Hypothetical predicted protein [Paramuricea clavata]